MGKILIIKGADFSEVAVGKDIITETTITVLASPFEGGTTTGSGSYAEGTQITISASANSGYIFTNWNDGDTNATRTITVGSSAKTYTAQFIKSSVEELFVLHAGGKFLWPGQPITPEGTPYVDEEIGVYNVQFSTEGEGGSTPGSRSSTWKSVDLTNEKFAGKTKIKITPKDGFRFSVAFGDDTIRITDWLYFGKDYPNHFWEGDLTNPHAKNLGISFSTPNDVSKCTSERIFDYCTIELT